MSIKNKIYILKTIPPSKRIVTYVLMQIYSAYSCFFLVTMKTIIRFGQTPVHCKFCNIFITFREFYRNYHENLFGN